MKQLVYFNCKWKTVTVTNMCTANKKYYPILKWKQIKANKIQIYFCSNPKEEHSTVLEPQPRKMFA